MGFIIDPLVRVFVGGRMTVEAGSTISTVINGTDYALGSDIIKGIRGAANTIHGNAGIDLLVGGDLRDVIDGGSEGDKIRGNGGADLLTGGSGADVFKYRAISESGLGANADTITDFLSGTDRLNFGRIDADANSAGDQAFTFVGTSAFTGGGVGSIRYSDLGADLRVEADVNGDGVADMHVLLQGAGLQTLSVTDFVL
jgi:serralysin